MSQTIAEFNEVIEKCRSIFEKKTIDYGTSWRILRLASITDQIFIKAQRIRSIQEKGTQKVDEDIRSEFVAIVNYCIMALIQYDMINDTRIDLTPQECKERYDKQVEITLDLLQNKNHDYGEAWRQMRVSSITDIILMKLLRIKQIEDNAGKTLISEGVDSGYRDIINYAVFSLIKLQ